MIGSIIGDIAGSPYEGGKIKQDKRNYSPFFLNQLSKFTDDTNLTIATADALLNNKPYEEMYCKWYNKNPHLGYGPSFVEWAQSGGQYINNSRGNGAVMRVSPIALFALNREFADIDGHIFPMTVENQLAWAYKESVESVRMTHNCDESRNGALAVLTAMILAGQRDESGNRIFDKASIQLEVCNLSKYDLTPTVETVRNEWSKNDCRCDITIPQALICFLESESFEDAIRLSVYSGGDVDTVACIAGGIAEHYYGLKSINTGIIAETKLRLQPEMIDIINNSYGPHLKW